MDESMCTQLLDPWDALCGDRILNAIRTDVRHPFNADANGVALDLGDLTVFFFEDPSDGYRSCAASPMVARSSMWELGAEPEYIRVPVQIRKHEKSDGGGEAHGLEFVDKRNGKIILVVGTDNSDDYYPSFICDWRPQNIASADKQ